MIFYNLIKLAKENPYKIDYFKDSLSLCKSKLKEDKSMGMVWCNELKKTCFNHIKAKTNVSAMVKFMHQIYIVESPYSLDSYFQALEFSRPIQDRFYTPRRKQLKPIVEKLQELIVDKTLDELFLSCPARIGKTALINYLITWLIGMYPEATSLYCSYSSTIAGTFYKGVYEILTDEYTYCWKKIFPNVEFDKNTMCNAKETYLDTGRVKKYHSITCRSIDAGLNGGCDCNCLLVGDDLVSGIEEAMNPEQLNKKWQKVDNDFLTRALPSAKRLWIGTRWSIGDPIGRRLSLLENDTKFKSIRYAVINIPALNENDESNFDYLYGKGFNTDYFQQRRASFEMSGDMASWSAQYMGEPIERSGLLFPTDNLKYFNGTLPSAKPDRIFAYCDIAWGGGDFLSFPICYQYGNDCYIVDWVFDSSDKFITRPKIINKILEHKITSAEFEKNNGGDEYKEFVENELLKVGYRLMITSKSAMNTKAKEIRIFEKAPEIKELYFLDNTHRNSEYSKAMTNLTTFSIGGKNKHDDAPDSLAGLIGMRNIEIKSNFEIFMRPF